MTSFLGDTRNISVPGELLKVGNSIAESVSVENHLSKAVNVPNNTMAPLAQF